MNYNFEYLDIVLLALFAGFIILRLREILGRKTGHERKVYQNFEQKDFKEKVDLNRPLSKISDFNEEDLVIKETSKVRVISKSNC